MNQNTNHRRARQLSKLWLAALATSVGLHLTGCEQQPKQTIATRSNATRATQTDHLSKAVDYIKRLDEFEKPQAMLQATFQLNRWIGDQPAQDSWQPDPMIKTLSREVREEVDQEHLAAMQFGIDDVDTVVEAVWMRDVALWVGGQQDASPIAKELLAQAATLGSNEGDQLTIAHRLFDWTVRQVELSELLDYPTAPLAVGTAVNQSPTIPAPKRLEPGPGYQLQPWQVLLYGSGDSLQRARVFIQLARQQAIPVVMLAFPGQTTPPRPRPWVTAALIGGDLYLFDPRLGIPLPGAEGRLIATLQEVIDDPSLLESLGVGEEFQYQIAPRDLNRVQALIDASFSALSLKAHLVESNLSGKDRMRLTVNATALRDRLADVPGVDEVSLWSLPFEADWYRAAIVAGIQTNKALDTEQYLKYGVFQARTDLVRGRYAHFRGEFDNDGEDLGAKTLYLESRMSNKQIAEIQSSEEVQEFFGVTKEQGEHDLSFRNRIAGTQLMVSQTKIHASYWLGLAQYDSGRPAAAVEWLNRTKDLSTDGIWTDGVRYNLGRAYEALGKIQEARELYLSDESTQQHGNVLRARLLRKHLSE